MGSVAWEKTVWEVVPVSQIGTGIILFFYFFIFFKGRLPNGALWPDLLGRRLTGGLLALEAAPGSLATSATLSSDIEALTEQTCCS